MEITFDWWLQLWKFKTEISGAIDVRDYRRLTQNEFAIALNADPFLPPFNNIKKKIKGLIWTKYLWAFAIFNINFELFFVGITH